VLVLKFKNLHHIARQIDHIIDHHLPTKGPSFISQEDLKKIVLSRYPDFFIEDCGWHKIVFGIHRIENKIVLKVGNKKTIENDHIAYKRVPHRLRHQVFARIFWHTKYCLLQEYGFSVQVTAQQLSQIRQTVYKYGINDIKKDNLRLVNGSLKIIDANITRIPLPNVLKIVDELKSRFPQRLNLFFKKIMRLLNE
jgi:hypothetical protein